jgi:dipeptidyl aminopeptidase/acylaminoacyl peptidase
MTLSPDGQLLAIASQDDGKPAILLLEAASGKQLRSIPCQAMKPNLFTFAMAFSPDGRRLAFTADTLRIADIETGEVVLSLGGHEHAVAALAFSPDGSRLASASQGREAPGHVQLWETKTGQELLTFKTVPGFPRDLAFKEKGSKLGLLISHGAVSSVVFWHAAPQSADDITRRDAIELVKSLFDMHPLRAEAIESLNGDTSLTTALRKAVLELAQLYPENAERLNNASWLIVASKRGTDASYRRALLLAQQACRLAPSNGPYLNTLGVAQYRAGEWAAARDTLLRSEQLNTARYKTGLPADLAFLAMARHRLGDIAGAEVDLARLRKAVATPPWASNGEAAAFLQEAEMLLKGQ